VFRNLSPEKEPFVATIDEYASLVPVGRSGYRWRTQRLPALNTGGYVVSIAAIILDLEQQLLDPTVRTAPSALHQLLSDVFMEFGSLGSDVVLATHRLIRTADTGATTCSLRSSVWRCREGNWQMYFHQGAPVGQRNSRG